MECADQETTTNVAAVQSTGPSGEEGGIEHTDEDDKDTEESEKMTEPKTLTSMVIWNYNT